MIWKLLKHLGVFPASGKSETQLSFNITKKARINRLLNHMYILILLIFLGLYLAYIILLDSSLIKNMTFFSSSN